MKVTYQQRVKKRSMYLFIGKFLVTKAAILLGIGGFILTIIFPKLSMVSLTLVGFASITAFFGSIFAIVISKVGWSDNIVVDILFNQLSIFLFIVSFISGLIFIGFLTGKETVVLPLLSVSISSLIVSLLLLLIGGKLQSPVSSSQKRVP